MYSAFGLVIPCTGGLAHIIFDVICFVVWSCFKLTYSGFLIFISVLFHSSISAHKWNQLKNQARYYQSFLHAFLTGRMIEKSWLKVLLLRVSLLYCKLGFARNIIDSPCGTLLMKSENVIY